MIEDEFIIAPEKIVDSCYDAEGNLEVLIQWFGLPSHETSWVKMCEAIRSFPDAKLQDKLILCSGGIDRPLRVYFRKQNKKIADE